MCALPVSSFAQISTLDWISEIRGVSSTTHAITIKNNLHPQIARLLQFDDDQLIQALGPMPVGLDGATPGMRIKDGGLYFDVIVHSDRPSELRSTGYRFFGGSGDFLTARLTLAQLKSVSEMPHVYWIEPPSLLFTQNEVSQIASGALAAHSGFRMDAPLTGKDVLVAVFDTGIDWTHPDFFFRDDPSQTRIKYIWDQTLTPQPGERSPDPPFNYGVLYDQADIHAALSGSGNIRSLDTSGHGTHVAGSAAGSGKVNAGLAPDAGLVIIKGGNQSFTTTDVVNGIGFMGHVSNSTGMPLAGNFSIGGTLSPRDGTDPGELAMNEVSASPGVAMVVAAGNSGNRMMHFSGVSGTHEIRITVPDYTPNSGAMNDRILLDIWFGTFDLIAVNLTAPDGTVFRQDPGFSGTFPDSTKGVTDIFNFIHEPNGHRRVLIDIKDAVEEYPPMPGDWTVSFEADGFGFNAWLVLDRVGNQFAAMQGGNNALTVTTPGTSFEAITAGAYVLRDQWINVLEEPVFIASGQIGDLAVFSGRGPTRDGRIKPDIAASGRFVASARSTTSNYSNLITLPGGMQSMNSGTSMATPQVTGAVALLLEHDPMLGSREIKEALQDGALTDLFTGLEPNTDWGHGILNVIGALSVLEGGQPDWQPRYINHYGRLNGPDGQTRTINASSPLERTFPLPGPGLLNSILIYTGKNLSGTGELVVTAWHSQDGQKTGRIGEPFTIAISELMPLYYQALDLSGSEIVLFHEGDVAIRFETTGEGEVEILTLNPLGIGSPLHVIDAGFMHYTGSDFDEVLNLRKPERISLEQNYPNPFNAGTRIRYSLTEPAIVSLQVFDILGRRVAVLDEGFREARFHSVFWDAAQMASGVYIYHLRAGNTVLTQKMTVVK